MFDGVLQVGDERAGLVFGSGRGSCGEDGWRPFQTELPFALITAPSGTSDFEMSRTHVAS